MDTLKRDKKRSIQIFFFSKEVQLFLTIKKLLNTLVLSN